MNLHLARLMRRFGRRPSPARPSKPVANRTDLIAVQSALARETGGIMDIKHPDAAFAPVETRLISKPRGTIFAFSGLSGVMGMPVKNFADSLKNFRKDLVFIKDFHQDWFQSGLTGVADNRTEMANFLHTNFGGCPRPWLFIGSSAGGFTAMHMGLTLGAERIVVFSPQTHIDAATFEHYRHESPDAAGFDASDPDNDLLNHPELGSPDSKVSFYYSDLSSYDHAQAARLFGTSNIAFHPVDTTWHNSASALKKAGMLKATFK